MDLITLCELREVFRQRMRERDFCLGEKEVERLFRELLGEPEPAPSTGEEDRLTAADMRHFNEALRASYHLYIDQLIDRNDLLYAQVRKK